MCNVVSAMCTLHLPGHIMTRREGSAKVEFSTSLHYAIIEWMSALDLMCWY